MVNTIEILEVKTNTTIIKLDKAKLEKSTIVKFCFVQSCEDRSYWAQAKAAYGVQKTGIKTALESILDLKDLTVKSNDGSGCVEIDLGLSVSECAITADKATAFKAETSIDWNNSLQENIGWGGGCTKHGEGYSVTGRCRKNSEPLNKLSNIKQFIKKYDSGTEYKWILKGDMSELFADVFSDNSNVSIPSNIDNWDVSGVTNFSSMFKNCNTFDKDLSKWDVSNGTDFSSMFRGCEKLSNPEYFCSWIGKIENKTNTDMFKDTLIESLENIKGKCKIKSKLKPKLKIKFKDIECNDKNKQLIETELRKKTTGNINFTCGSITAEIEFDDQNKKDKFSDEVNNGTIKVIDGTGREFTAELLTDKKLSIGIIALIVVGGLALLIIFILFMLSKKKIIKI